MPDLKPGWRKYRFDEIAHNVNQRVDDPTQAGVEHYIGLDHLDSDGLKIRRWGSPSDVSATKLLFEPGDIIFGRRRAYQRKLGVAEFRGIASAHALVLRAKPEVALPEFLPFFMQSDLFMQRAQEISVGSLSPTINWKTLAKQEFALPPRDEQKRLSIVLMKQTSLLQSYQNAIDALLGVESALLRKEFGLLPEPSRPCILLKQIAEVRTGAAKGRKADSETVQCPYLRVANVLDGALELTEIKRITVRQKDVEKYTLNPGDVLMTEGGDLDKLGRGTVWQGEVSGC